MTITAPRPTVTNRIRAIAAVLITVAIALTVHGMVSHGSARVAQASELPAYETHTVVAYDATITVNIVDTSTGKAPSGYVLNRYAQLIDSWGQGDEAYEVCMPIELDQVTPQEQAYLFNADWAGDPADGMEALYAPGC